MSRGSSSEKDNPRPVMGGGILLQVRPERHTEKGNGVHGRRCFPLSLLGEGAEQAALGYTCRRRGFGSDMASQPRSM